VRRENSLARKNSWRKQGSSSITWGVVVGEDNCGSYWLMAAIRFTVGQQIVRPSGKIRDANQVTSIRVRFLKRCRRGLTHPPAEPRSNRRCPESLQI
jgi:hypothetical protein